MELPVLVDSNVYIDLLRARRDPVRELLGLHALDDIVCCGVVKAEVLRGVVSLKARARLEDFFAVTQMVATNAALWDDAWQLAWRLDREGKTLPLTDLVIAACAFKAGAAVMSLDRHFQEIPGLRVTRPE